MPLPAVLRATNPGSDIRKGLSLGVFVFTVSGNSVFSYNTFCLCEALSVLSNAFLLLAGGAQPH